jgi:CBS domain-containing protein
MPVSDLANKDVVTASRDTSVMDVAKMMKEKGVGDVVITEDEKPVGIVTDRQIVMALAEESDVSSAKASDLMTENPETINANAEAIELTRKFGEVKVRRLPVVDENGALSGIVSLDDVIATIGEEMNDIANVIEAQSPGYSP